MQKRGMEAMEYGVQVQYNQVKEAQRPETIDDRKMGGRQWAMLSFYFLPVRWCFPLRYASTGKIQDLNEHRCNTSARKTWILRYLDIKRCSTPNVKRCKAMLLA
jgi:hypothetical protein